MSYGNTGEAAIKILWGMCLTSSCALKYAWRELQVDGEKILSELNKKKDKTRVIKQTTCPLMF